MAGRPDHRPGYSRTFSSGYESYQPNGPNYRDDPRWEKDCRPPTGPRRQSNLRSPARSPSPRAPPEHVSSAGMQNTKKRKADSSPDAAASKPSKQIVSYSTSRKPSIQTYPGAMSTAIPSSLLKDPDRFSVQSPSSIEGGRSVRQDDSSTRSSPQPQNAVTATNGQPVVLQPTPMDALHASIAETVSVQKLCQTYREEITRLETENAPLKSIFITNPTVKAARKKQIDDKRTQLETCEILLLQKKGEEQEVWQAMFDSQRATHDAKLLAEIDAKIRTGHQSRADYEQLEKRYDTLKTELAEQKATLAKLQKAFGVVEEVAAKAERKNQKAVAECGQIPRILNRINVLEKTVPTNATNITSDMTECQQQIGSAQIRLLALEKASSETSTSQKDVKALKDVVRDHEQLHKTVEKLVQYHDQLNKLVTDSLATKVGHQSKEMSKLSSDLNSCAETCVKNTTAIKNLEDMFGQCDRALSALKDDSKEIRADFSVLSKRVTDQLKSSAPKEKSKEQERQAAKDEYDMIKRQVLSVHEQVVELEGRFEKHEDRYIAEVYEEGKPTVVKRFKRYDQVLNNCTSQLEKLVVQIQPKNQSRLEKLEIDSLASKKELKELKDRPVVAPQQKYVDSDTVQRVDKLERDGALFNKSLLQLENRVAAIRQVPQGGEPVVTQSKISPLLTAGIQDLGEKIDKLEERLDGFDDEARTKDDMVAEEINNRYTQLSNDIASLDDRSNASKNQLASEITRLSERFDTRSERLGTETAANQRAIAVLEASTASMAEKVQILERRSVAPPGPMVAPGPPQFKPVSRASPAVQDPRNSPQANGFYGAAAVNQELENVKSQCIALSGFVTHLKTRFDNLTTDEVVKAMVGQMREMYPAAGDFQAAVTKLSQTDKDLSDKIDGMGARISAIWSRTQGSIGEVTGTADSTARMAAELKANIASAISSGVQNRQQLANIERMVQEVAGRSVAPQNGNEDHIRQQLANIERKIKDVAGRSTTSQSGIDDHILKRLPNQLNEQTTAIKKRLQEVETLANEHHTQLTALTTKQNTFDRRLINTTDSLASLKGRADKIDPTINLLSDVTKKAIADITALETNQTKTNNSILSLESSQTKTNASILSLEKMAPKLDRVLQGMEHTSSLAQSLEDEVAGLAAIKALPQRVTDVEMSIKALPQRVTAVEKSAEELQLAKAGIAKEFEGFNKRISEVEDLTATMEVAIDTVQKTKGEIDGRIERLEREKGVEART